MKTLLLLAALTNAVVADNKQPNIVLVLADDLGWANVGYHRAEGDRAIPETHTPNIDKLAKKGVKLSRHYTYRICGPSRASLQSGRFAVHVNVYNTGVTVKNPKDPVSGYTGVPRNMTVFARKLKDAGYATHMVGKWDIGMATPEHTPKGRGYDSWIGYYTHANDYWNKGMGLISDQAGFAIVGEIDNCVNQFTDLSEQNDDYCGGVREKKFLADDYYEEDIFRNRALKIIKEHNTDVPLFLFYSSHLIHTPLQIPEKYVKIVAQRTYDAGGKYDISSRRLYAAMVYYLDEALGMMVDGLKKKDMWDNTVLVFISDNGGPTYVPAGANNHPLKGGKYSDWEGGIRGTAFVTGGHVPKSARGSTFNGVVSIADWYATFCRLAGADFIDYAALDANVNIEQMNRDGYADEVIPYLHPVDGRNQWDAIISGTEKQPSKQNIRPDVFHISPQSVMIYPWKLITGEHPYSAWHGEFFPNCSSDGPYPPTWPAAAEHGPLFSDFKFMDEPTFIGGKHDDQPELTQVYDCGKQGCLFNIEADPSEHINEVGNKEYRHIHMELMNALAMANMSIFHPNRGHPTSEACSVAIDQGGFYGPFSDLPDNYYTPRDPEPDTDQKMAEAALKLQLKVYDDPKVREELKVYIDYYGESNLAHVAMNTIDNCIYDNGTLQKNVVCFANGTCTEIPIKMP